LRESYAKGEISDKEIKKDFPTIYDVKEYYDC